MIAQNNLTKVNFDHFRKMPGIRVDFKTQHIGNGIVKIGAFISTEHCLVLKYEAKESWSYFAYYLKQKGVDCFGYGPDRMAETLSIFRYKIEHLLDWELTYPK